MALKNDNVPFASKIKSAVCAATNSVQPHNTPGLVARVRARNGGAVREGKIAVEKSSVSLAPGSALRFIKSHTPGHNMRQVTRKKSGSSSHSDQRTAAPDDKPNFTRKSATGTARWLK